MLDGTAEGGGCPHLNNLGFFSLVDGGRKIDQVVGGDILNVVEKRADGGAKFCDGAFQFLSFRNGEQGTQLADSLLGGDCHRVEYRRNRAKILYRVSRRCLRCMS